MNYLSDPSICKNDKIIEDRLIRNNRDFSLKGKLFYILPNLI